VRKSTFGEALEFIPLVHRHLGRGFILVLDRHNTHKKAVRLLREKHPGWLEAEWLPGYAPDLNPVEGAGQQLKHVGLRNMVCVDLEELHLQLDAAIARLRQKPHLIWSFFAGARLPLGNEKV